jgi:hypothetical protein
MNRNMTLMVMIASYLFTGNAFCADWKYYGEFSTAPDVQNALFYDSSSIKNTNNSIKLWVKIVLLSEINECLENKLVTEKTTKKTASGYSAPITKINPKVSKAAYLEEAANQSSIKSKAEILYQINCAEKKFRKISGSSFNKDGNPVGRFGISEWEDITPESNADNLAKIVCGSK